MNRFTRLGLLSAALLIFAPANARNFTPEDLVQLNRLGGSTVSADGATLLFSLSETDLDANGRHRDLWVLDLREPAAAPERWRPSAASNESAPVFSADGATVYFLSDRSGTSQVWRAPLGEGDALQVTDVEADVAGFSIAPGGERIALWFDEARDCGQTSCPDAPDADHAGSGRIYDEIFVRHWGSWNDDTQSRLVTFTLTEGVAAGEGVVVSRPLNGNTPSRPFGGGEEIAWHPSGASLFFGLREAGPTEPISTDLDIYRVSADGSSAPELLTAENDALDSLPTPSPDGRYLAYVAMARPGYESDRTVLHLRDLVTGETRALTQNWDRSVQGIAWAPDGQSIWMVAKEGLDTAVFRYVLARGAIERVSGAGSISSLSPQSDGSLVVTMASALAPSDLYRLTPDGTMDQLTNVNGARLAEIEMPVREEFSFRGAQGDTVRGQIFRPAGLAEGERVPVALFVHGGPQGSFSNSWSYRWNPAAMAAQGYAAVTIDFHGSTGYGQAFTDSINNDWGGKPLRDLQLGLEAVLAANPWMDGERVCALGASYGGYMMNWIAGNWADRFDCLVNHAGIFDLRQFYYSTEELWFPEQDFGGPYHERETAYERWNPVHHVENWQTPMLVVHGERDFRIPYSQSLAAFTALQRQGIASELLVFPDENHWVLAPRNSLQWHRTVYDWVARWTASEGPEDGE
ncbi:alpha/beta hydrolase family protein [Parasphingopyxis lamellibrachiae]|uniref:Dipeptidyl aminopeptidase/acylaminoacyl peptidase n=1 Tax=Parasphingopyxis lamellibrachiae TaxID=680125 RepID=A0A3D9FFA0_9SPHN|nr:S9 family peptidase [Parasphingopyxis lamellibrachiae]RED15751.1 dipeptidyl aminopeptidase/acylaminoacyl peptidase [Parasphingopyxis lamellibrachiae]